MKRNLFLTLMLGMAVSTAYAEETWVTEAKTLAENAATWVQSEAVHASTTHKPEGYTNHWYGAHTTGNWAVESETDYINNDGRVLDPENASLENAPDAGRIGINSVLNIGCYVGAAETPAHPASLAIKADASTGNCLFVGGVGYTGDVGHDDFWAGVSPQTGYLTVMNGATLTVGTNTTSALGAQLNVGQAENGVGYMLVDGEGSHAVSNAIMAVGNGIGAHGEALVDNKGKVTVQATAAIADYGTALHLGVGSGSQGYLTVDHGSSLEVLGSLHTAASSLTTENSGPSELGAAGLGSGKATSYIGEGSAARESATGVVTVNNGSTLVLEGITTVGYYDNAQGELNVQNGSVATSEGLQLGIDSKAEGTVNVESGSTLDLTGTFYAGVRGKGTLNVAGSGTKLISAASVCAGYAAGSEGAVNITEGAEALVAGTVYIGRDGKGILNNNGTLSGKTIVNGNGELHGAGTFGTTTVTGGGKVFVGDDAPVTQTYTGNLTLEESTTSFSVTDLTLPSSEAQNAWVSESHSLIKMETGTAFSINADTRFLIDFSGEDMPSESSSVNLGDFSILLVEGGVGSDVAALCDTLLSNSTFTFSTDSLGRATDKWAATIEGAYYKVANNNLYLVAGSIPEPATATLSLLALAALAARRRRK